MEIVLGETAGFCFGVKNVVEKSKKGLEKHNKIYCLGEILHNKEVTKQLENRGMIFIENIREAKDNLIIRSHGATKETYKKAEKLKLNIIDLTCPKVLRIHKLAEKYDKEGYFIFLIGQKKHAETIGTVSFCGKNCVQIEHIEEVEKAIDKFIKSKMEKAVTLVQTTYSLETFKEIVNKIQQNVSNLQIENTICNDTKQKQEEVESLAKRVEYMIVIGGKNSSNSNKLYEIAKKNCPKSIFIENESELNLEDLKKINKVGIMAGASTPDESITKIVEILNNL